MDTITSAHLSVATDRIPDSVLVSVHGAFDASTAARLQRVLEEIFEDRETVTICVDLHDVHGVDTAGLLGLVAAAGLADQRGKELTLADPPELLCGELESRGLTGLIRMGRQDSRPFRRATGIDRRKARGHHPASQLLA